jgi:hypothetical protein
MPEFIVNVNICSRLYRLTPRISICFTNDGYKILSAGFYKGFAFSKCCDCQIPAFDQQVEIARATTSFSSYRPILHGTGQILDRAEPMLLSSENVSGRCFWPKSPTPTGALRPKAEVDASTKQTSGCL